MTKRKLNKALQISCDLLNYSIIYGIDADRLFELVMDRYGFVCGTTYAKFILKNLDRFSDNPRKRNRAIKRLGC